MSNDAVQPSGGVPLPPPTGAPVQLPPPPKKPLFRKWWFWVLVVLGVLIVISALSPRSDSESESPTMEEASESGPIDPQTLTGGTLKAAIDALRVSGATDEGILVVDSGAVISPDQSVYETQGFTIDNLGSDEFQEGQTICGVQVNGAGTSGEVVVLWAESSCSEAEQRLTDLKAAASAEESADVVEPTPVESEAAVADEPMSSDAFLMLARGDIADFAKDLGDMAKAASEGGIFRVIGNSVELSFNLAQLQSYTPPAEIEAEWNAGLEKLAKRVDAIDAAISGDASTGALNDAINSAANALLELDEVLGSLN